MNLEGFSFKTCSVCEEMAGAVVAFLSTYQYDLITSDSAREHLAELGGFCAMHTWQFDVLAGARGTCVAMSTVLARFAERIRELATDGSVRTDRLLSLLGGGERCPACDIMRGAERAAIATAANSVQDYAAGSVLCLVHFAHTVDALPNDALRVRFAESQASAVARLADDMHGFVIKFDSTRRDLMEAEERNADRRGLSMLAGSRGRNGIAVGS
ncbi:MAG: hypothetical protein WBG27_00985 [Candidatus Aquilonibacter sp.]